MSEPLYFVEREYPVSLDRLWSAWVNASELEQWYSPTDLSVVPGSVVSQPEVGGTWAVAVDAQAYGFIAYFWGIYTAVRPHLQLVHTMNYSQDVTDFEARLEDALAHTIHIDFEGRESGAWVRFSQFGEMPAEQAEASRQGMTSYFDSLARFLAE